MALEFDAVIGVLVQQLGQPQQARVAVSKNGPVEREIDLLSILFRGRGRETLSR